MPSASLLHTSMTKFNLGIPEILKFRESSEKMGKFPINDNIFQYFCDDIGGKGNNDGNCVMRSMQYADTVMPLFEGKGVFTLEG